MKGTCYRYGDYSVNWNYHEISYCYDWRCVSSRINCRFVFSNITWAIWQISISIPYYIPYLRSQQTKLTHKDDSCSGLTARSKTIFVWLWNINFTNERGYIRYAFFSKNVSDNRWFTILIPHSSVTTRLFCTKCIMQLHSHKAVILGDSYDNSWMRASRDMTHTSHIFTHKTYTCTHHTYVLVLAEFITEFTESQRNKLIYGYVSMSWSPNRSSPLLLSKWQA